MTELELSLSSYIFHINFSIHVVFGHVVSGQEVVRQIENLPVDRNSRPLEEPVVKTCGELVKQTKGTILYH